MVWSPPIQGSCIDATSISSSREMTSRLVEVNFEWCKSLGPNISKIYLRTETSTDPRPPCGFAEWIPFTFAFL